MNRSRLMQDEIKDREINGFIPLSESDLAGHLEKPENLELARDIDGKLYDCMSLPIEKRIPLEERTLYVKQIKDQRNPRIRTLDPLEEYRLVELVDGTEEDEPIGGREIKLKVALHSIVIRPNGEISYSCRLNWRDQDKKWILSGSYMYN